MKPIFPLPITEAISSIFLGGNDSAGVNKSTKDKVLYL